MFVCCCFSHVSPRWRKVVSIINFSAKGTMSRKSRILEPSVKSRARRARFCRFFCRLCGKIACSGPPNSPNPFFTRAHGRAGGASAPHAGGGGSGPAVVLILSIFLFFRGNPRVFQGKSEGFSRGIQGFFKGNPRGFQGES